LPRTVTELRRRRPSQTGERTGRSDAWHTIVAWRGSLKIGDVEYRLAWSTLLSTLTAWNGQLCYRPLGSLPIPHPNARNWPGFAAEIPVT
jgi:hypothetical protein